MSLRTLVTDPDGFFAARRDDYSLAGPAAVVVAHALLALAGTVVILQAVGDVVTAADAASIVYASGGQRVSAPRDIVLALWATGGLYFAGWIAVAVVAYLVSLYFDGDGSFRRLLAFVGWTFVPTLAPTAVRAVVIAAMFLEAPDFATEAALQEWAQSELTDHPARFAAIAVRPLFTLWMVYLWVLAAEHARELTRRQALVVVALPAAFATLNAVGTLATAAGRALGLF
ncbi:YIP1 family protein [Halosimplex pelagicum]|uniref:YIP1 family protein n=1 Tax=Halosimplex pelagicum TaxID=869886 RepID=A0A7D5TDV6_9EURY|nr:YIP1 family protein [Halosimplex pelagicum]QLH84129.1 YIP1 family protein [Halosimplex pelagicum]